MGNFLSTSSPPVPKQAAPEASAAFRAGGERASSSGGGALFLSEVKAEPATWSQEGICHTIQRLFGLLPDSAVRQRWSLELMRSWGGPSDTQHLHLEQAEELKKEQRHPRFQRRPSAYVRPCRPTWSLTLVVELTSDPPAVVPADFGSDGRSFGLNLHLRADAVVAVQRVYRRYRVLTRWHDVAGQILELARSRIETRREIEEEQVTLTRFRELLGAGFSAHKVSITGALKAIHLQLVMNTGAEECYLTWSPSRKRQPRIHLRTSSQSRGWLFLLVGRRMSDERTCIGMQHADDIEQVVPVLRTGNKHAPRLASKVSHRRGLIIVCKSHHRGRVVLEMSSKRERNLLLCGFERLLEEMNRLDPMLDDAGTIRKRLPRRQSVIEFFDPETRPPAFTTGAGTDRTEEPLATSPPSRRGSKAPGSSPTSPIGAEQRNSATMEQLYSTRFDSASGTSTVHLRRTSMVMAVPAQT